MAKKADYSKVEHVLNQSLKAAKSGKYTQEQINQYILDSGFKSLKAFENAVVNRASIDVFKDNPKSEKGVIRGYMREVANGLTMGLWGKGEALVSSIINGTPYDYERDLMETERAEYQEANPVHSTVGNLGGAMVTGGALTKAAMSKLPFLAPTTGAPVLNYAKEAGMEGVIGAGEAGMTALTEGGDVKGSTTMGGVAGMVAPALSRVVSPMVDVAKEGGRIVKEAFGGKQTPSMSEKRAMDKLEESFTDDAISPADRRQRLQDFEDAKMGDDVGVGYLGGENVSQLAKDSQVTKGPARTAVKKQLVEDMETNRERVQEFMKDGLGYHKKGAPQTVDEMGFNMNKEAAPHYEEAFDHPNIKSEIIDEVMAHKEFRKAYREAVETNRLNPEGQDMPELPEGGQTPVGGWSVYALDQVKKQVNLLRRLPPSAQNAPDKLRAEMLGKQVNILLGELDDQVPAYKTARWLWGDGAAERDAYEKGLETYRMSKKAEQVEYDFNQLETEAEREMFRLGASTEGVAKMDQAVSPTKSHSKIFSSPDQLKKHQILFATPEEAAKFQKRLELLTEMHQKAGDQIPRSDSGANLSRFVGRAWDLVSNTRGGNIISKGAGLIADPLQAVQQRSTNKALGQMLAERGRQPTARTLQNLENRQKELSQNMLNRSLLTGGITGAGAHLLGGKDKKQGSLLEPSY